MDDFTDEERAFLALPRRRQAAAAPPRRTGKKPPAAAAARNSRGLATIGPQQQVHAKPNADLLYPAVSSSWRLIDQGDRVVLPAK